MVRAVVGLWAVTCLAQPSVETVVSFEKVWQTVERRHWDPESLERLPDGRSWRQVHDEYRRLIFQATSDAQARGLISQMLGLLGQSHYAVLAGEPSDDLTPMSGGEGATGIDPMFTEGRMLVRGVAEGSPAAEAGVRPGWEIVRIDGFDVRSAVTRVQRRSGQLKQPGSVLRMLTLGRLSGPAGVAAKVVFAGPKDQPIERSLVRQRPPGTLTRFGFLPPTLLEFQSKRPRPDVGYVRFNLFLDPPGLMKKFEDAVLSCLRCRGFVIDLRGNPGGLAILAASMAGFLIDTPDVKLGTLYQREVKLKLVVNPRVDTFAGPVAVLVDSSSVSTSEIMAGGLQDLKRARIFGERTAGAALPSMVERLPNGDLFQFAVANYVSEGGQALEGRGVMPDTVVPTTRAALLSGQDPVLEAALDWVYAQKPLP